MKVDNNNSILSAIEPKIKLWLEVDGEVVFGSGRMALFQYIEEAGSIKQAAEKLNMSYRAAWGKIKATEERLGLKLVERQAGGLNSGASLTAKGKHLLMIYKKYKQDVDAVTDNVFHDFFMNLRKEDDTYTE